MIGNDLTFDFQLKGIQSWAHCNDDSIMTLYNYNSVINGEIDFKSVEAVVALNRALLWVDFGLDVHLPKGRLCPTIANR